MTAPFGRPSSVGAKGGDPHAHQASHPSRQHHHRGRDGELPRRRRPLTATRSGNARRARRGSPCVCTRQASTRSAWPAQLAPRRDFPCARTARALARSHGLPETPFRQGAEPPQDRGGRRPVIALEANPSARRERDAASRASVSASAVRSGPARATWRAPRRQRVLGADGRQPGGSLLLASSSHARRFVVSALGVEGVRGLLGGIVDRPASSCTRLEDGAGLS